MGDRRKVVIIGCGVAALETAIGLYEDANIEVDVTMICPTNEFNYRPFAALEPFGIRHVDSMPIDGLLAGCEVQIIHDKVSRVDKSFGRVMTSRGELVDFDALVVTTGAESVEGLRGAITIGDAAGTIKLEHLLRELDAGLFKSIAYVAPTGASWTLPLYEMAMLTAARARQRGHVVAVKLITSEQVPLQVFGEKASAHTRQLLNESGVELHTNIRSRSFTDGKVTTISGQEIAVDRAVALPHLVGRRIPGLPHDPNGFLPTDGFGLVHDTEAIYAAGDITDFPVKQGSIAAQQADAVVSSLAARFGDERSPRPFKPRLHAILLSDRAQTFLRASDDGGPHRGADVSDEPLWEDAEKIFSRHLSQRMRRLRAAGTKMAAR